MAARAAAALGAALAPPRGAALGSARRLLPVTFALNALQQRRALDAAHVRAAEPALGPDGGAGGKKEGRGDAVPPSRSWLELRLPFSSDAALRDAFRAFRTDAMRVGPVMEVMDTFAADIAVRHTGDPTANVVTATVDNIEWGVSERAHERQQGQEKEEAGQAVRPGLAGVPTVRDDLVLRGAVCRAGLTSMDVLLELHSVRAPEDGSDGEVARRVGGARFVFVRRPAEAADHSGREVAPPPPRVPALVAESSNERALLVQGQRLYRQYKAERGERGTPTAEEIAFVHASASPVEQQDGVDAGIPGHWTDIENTLCENVQVVHGQDRNSHGQLFGGWLMRKSFELAWCTGHLHALRPPVLRHVDEITFTHPVPIGAILRTSALVTYVEGNSMAVAVSAEVVNPRTGEGHTTNEFRYTFSVDDATEEGAKEFGWGAEEGGGEEGAPLRRVRPRRYRNVARFLAGRRAVARARAFQASGQAGG